MGLALAFLACLAIGWLMFQHVPSWYQPVAVAPAEKDRIRNDLFATQDDLTQGFNEHRETFQHGITQDQINDWLAAREAIWPRSREWLPPEVSKPFVAFTPEGIHLAATINIEGVQTVVSARLAVSADDAGVHVRLVEIRSGAVSVPPSWIRDQLASLDQHGWPAGERVKYQLSAMPLPPLAGLLDGITLPNEWVWWDSKRPFRVVGMESKAGEFVGTFEPLDP